MLKLLSFFASFRERLFGPAPLPGWEERYKGFKAGRTVWPSPTPGTPDLIPWPAEWLCITTEGLVGEESLARGFDFIPIVCQRTEKETPEGEGVRCLRCGVNLHPSAANLVSSFSPPYCDLCVRYICRVLV